MVNVFPASPLEFPLDPLLVQPASPTAVRTAAVRTAQTFLVAPVIPVFTY
jgi:hypothetical protein